MKRTAILPEKDTVVIGPYSPGVRMKDLVFLSGQVSASGGSAAQQTEEALNAIEGLLKASGLELDDVAFVQIYLKNIQRDFDAMNEVYARRFNAPYPARVTVQAVLARQEDLVEITVVAVNRQ